ncbi:transcription termination factor rho family protein [Pseudanabaena galeata UHCC 0370]|uniref:Transcription termination factor rho family protein n=1 Tax=Pseudanabaena galeata UHCC 0370 TaxID=3110310 RepID=A0ABU5TI94_9CYAN|nr:transcription termination factor rho family protein [Pseudanabaena galeata]MEA5477974.1 transcription termination factor rho family protein [Pseudanabaena galeata UHCC 0370]
MTNNIQLMHLWLHEITVPDPTDAPQFVLDVVSQALSVSGGKNWIPVIVKEVSKGEYVVVANSFIYAAAENAGLEKVWCVIVDNEENAEYLTKVLAREIVPKLDLANASYEQIQGALEYVSEKPNSALKGFKLLVAVNRIAEAPRQNWKSLDELTKLKCGITKGKKLDALKEVFTLNVKSVKEPVEVNAPKPIQSLDSLSLTELKAMAKDKKLKGYSKKTKAELVDLLS